MAIMRKYESKEECVGLFVDENFDAFPSWTVTEQPGFFESWDFVGYDTEYDDEKDEDVEVYGGVCVPMWNDWFIPNWFVRHFIEEHEEEVAAMGFTLVYHDGNLFALGVDGAGYSFRDTHFTRLYDAMGITWHE